MIGCAATHKRERNALIERLQNFAAEKHVRITILSGDVHLAAVGRFYTTSALNIPQVLQALSYICSCPLINVIRRTKTRDIWST